MKVELKLFLTNQTVTPKSMTMPVFYLLIRQYVFKGGPIDNPYWLPWAPLRHRFSLFYVYI